MTKTVFLLMSGITASLLVTAQSNEAGIDKQFAQYSKKTFTEKVYLHTDKNYYLAGEILWWKLYYVDGYFHKPAGLSKVVYVEILDANNKPVLQAKAALNKEGSDGSFYLPVSVNSGNYTLRAYTNWMKNFGADYFFEKHIAIVNSMKALGPQTAPVPAAYDAGFFPEGGNLVRNMESRVGFRVTDQFGRGQNFTGALINENNDTLLQFSPLKFGIGSFSFTPSSNHVYKAVIRIANGPTLLRNLPAVYDKGYVMKLETGADGTLKVVVSASQASSPYVYLFAHTRQLVKASMRARLENGFATFTIDKNKLGEGISQLTLFDDSQQPLCERLYFKYPEHHLAIAANTNAATYASRKKVSLLLQTKTAAGAAPANVSVAVYRLDSLQLDEGNDIQSYLWLSSDLAGTVESPNYYFNDVTTVTKEAMDNLMLTHGWRRFNWDTVIKDTAHIAWQPEFDGHIINGTVSNASSGVPGQGLTTYLSIPGAKVQFYPVLSDSSGNIRFDVRDYYGPGELVLQVDNNSFSNYRFDIANPFSESYTTDRRPYPLQIPENLGNDITKASIGMQVQNVYRTDQLSKFDPPAIDTLAFYGTHGAYYDLDDYVRFTTVEEVLREYVLEVGIRRRNGQLQLLVTDFVNKGFFSRDPIILLDGVPVSHEKILGYDPLKIKKLQVVASRYLYGDFVYDGVVSFSTYRNTVENLQLNTKTMTIDYEGLQMKREFFSPVYETEQQIGNRLPDFRTLLYWSPNVKTSNTGTADVDFYTADTDGKYVVVIEGMDNAGNAGSYSFTFDVKR